MWHFGEARWPHGLFVVALFVVNAVLLGIGLAVSSARRERAAPPPPRLRVNSERIELEAPGRRTGRSTRSQLRVRRLRDVYAAPGWRRLRKALGVEP